MIIRKYMRYWDRSVLRCKWRSIRLYNKPKSRRLKDVGKQQYIFIYGNPESRTFTGFFKAKFFGGKF